MLPHDGAVIVRDNVVDAHGPIVGLPAVDLLWHPPPNHIGARTEVLIIILAFSFCVVIHHTKHVKTTP